MDYFYPVFILIKNYRKYLIRMCCVYNSNLLKDDSFFLMTHSVDNVYDNYLPPGFRKGIRVLRQPQRQTPSEHVM